MVPYGFYNLFNFLFQVIKQFAVKKFFYSYIQTVAYLFYGYDAGILAFFVKHTVYGRRRHTGYVGQGVYGYVFFTAELKYSFFHGFFYVHPMTTSFHSINQMVFKFTINREGYIVKNINLCYNCDIS